MKYIPHTEKRSHARITHLFYYTAIAAQNASWAAHNPHLAAHALLQRLERGDADSSGSTIRTLFVVMLVVTLVPIFAVTLIGLMNGVAGRINSVPPNP